MYTELLQLDAVVTNVLFFLGLVVTMMSILVYAELKYVLPTAEEQNGARKSLKHFLVKSVIISIPLILLKFIHDVLVPEQITLYIVTTIFILLGALYLFYKHYI